MQPTGQGAPIIADRSAALSFIPRNTAMLALLRPCCRAFLFAAVLCSFAAAQTIEDAPPSPTTCHGVQLGAHDLRSDADQQLSSLLATGLSDLLIEERDGRHCVLQGPFAYEVEAIAWQHQLRDTISDVSVVSMPVGEGQTFSDALPAVYGTTGQTAASAALASMRGISAYTALEALDGGNAAVYRTALKNALPSHPTSDPMHGYIVANLGILDLKAGRDHYTSALSQLRPVADGTIAASASVRVMAMVRSAWLIHQTGDRLQAFRAWRETEQFSNSETVKARCRVEWVALMMELAECDKGTHADMRHAAQVAYAAYPNQLKRRAVLELMFAETFSRQPAARHALSAQLCGAFVEKYTPLNVNGALDREIYSAMYQAGLFHERAGNISQALDWYEHVLSVVPSDFEGFAGAHPHAEALGGLSRQAARDGNTELQRAILRDIVKQYPNSQLARKILNGYSHLVQETGSEE